MAYIRGADGRPHPPGGRSIVFFFNFLHNIRDKFLRFLVHGDLPPKKIAATYMAFDSLKLGKIECELIIMA